jgi:hypothetical protein
MMWFSIRILNYIKWKEVTGLKYQDQARSCKVSKVEKTILS